MGWGKQEVTAAQPEQDPKVVIEDLLKGIDSSKIEKVLHDMCAAAMKRYRQELIGENEDSFGQAIRKYRSKVARRTWHVAQKWCKWTEEGPLLMPDNTRLYYRKGKTEVIVQEFPPQVRLMKFRGALVNRENSTTKQSESNANKQYTYSLALPYVVFIYRFIDGLFQDCYIAFSDRPLKRLQERPLRPFLSNLDSNLKLCHGSSFVRDDLIKGDLIQQVALILNNFWQTTYSDEWSSHFWANKNHFTVDTPDERMVSMEKWQEASIENPLFVIDDVNWLNHTEENFGDMVVRLFDGDQDDSAFQQELYNDLSENFIEEVGKIVEENSKAVEQKSVAGLEGLAGDLLTQLAKLCKR